MVIAKYACPLLSQKDIWPPRPSATPPCQGESWSFDRVSRLRWALCSIGATPRLERRGVPKGRGGLFIFWYTEISLPFHSGSIWVNGKILGRMDGALTPIGFRVLPTIPVQQGFGDMRYRNWDGRVWFGYGEFGHYPRIGLFAFAPLWDSFQSLSRVHLGCFGGFETSLKYYCSP